MAVLLLSPLLFLAQRPASDSLRGKFTYLLKSKPNKLFPERVNEEAFSLQIGMTDAYFVSEKRLIGDSILSAVVKLAVRQNPNNVVVDMRGKGLPQNYSRFLIIQNAHAVKYFLPLGMSVLYYTQTAIKNWKLEDETKTISGYPCRKATLAYKGRKWTAWYTTEIPLFFGPYKFGGLPGLIVKISDEAGDYDFELVKSFASSRLSGQTITAATYYLHNAIEVPSREKLMEAEKSFQENRLNELENMGGMLSPQQRTEFLERERARRQKAELEKPGYNPLELE